MLPELWRVELTMEIFCIQTDIAWEDRPANFARIEAQLDGVMVPSGSLLVFPELCTAGFTMNVAGVAEAPDGESARFFGGLAHRFSSHVIAGIPGLNPVTGRGRNEAVCFSPDGAESARYRKLHLFTFAGEGGHYEPGSELVTVDCDGWKVAPLICYDLRFPEEFRTLAHGGAEVFVVMANWPAIREDHWLTLLRARAIENQAYVVGVNRCGSDPKLEYSGASLVVGPTGQVLARAGSEPTVLRARLERAAIDDWRRDFPALSDAAVRG